MLPQYAHCSNTNERASTMITHYRKVSRSLSPSISTLHHCSLSPYVKNALHRPPRFSCFAARRVESRDISSNRFLINWTSNGHGRAAQRNPSRFFSCQVEERCAYAWRCLLLTGIATLADWNSFRSLSFTSFAISDSALPVNGRDRAQRTLPAT